MAAVEKPMGSERRRGIGIVVTVLLVVIAGGLGWWAGGVALAPSSTDAPTAAGPVWATSSEGSVGRSLQYSVTLRQPVVPVAFNGLSGVVTQTGAGEVDLGDVLYRVGEVPVRAVEAKTPLWRDLKRDVRGDDVKALQELLVELGHLSGKSDGIFDARTEAAVKAWQKAERRAQSGVVVLGELVGLPKLPVTVSLGEEIASGRVLTGGEEAVRAPTGAREFVLALTQDQARQVPSEATVKVSFEEHAWEAVILGSRSDESGQMVFDLASAEGGEVCGDDCGALPLDEQVTLRSEVIVIPEVTGVVVPVAAVRTTPSGQAMVTTEMGEVPVTVLGSGQGIAVIEGLEAGVRVQVGVQDASSAESPGAEASPGASEEGG
ncbi:peptidoglycan-binding domain-containing protein [Tessaracoccus caeni]|uniref:peptidoglycan-binding domain-containing protein n=1 Tax=Tessaracoccus caeni TaxID=3031239 RepID=UPI0023DB2D5F|nr:peptidoglycan-binding domain-containing protein [Tessaracoccus caeni]